MGEKPSATLLATASGTTFAVIAVMQMANAFACRSESVPAWRLPLTTDRLVLGAVAAEAVLLLAFVGVPWLADLLGGSWPSLPGWVAAVASAVLLVLVDGVYKGVREHRRRRRHC